MPASRELLAIPWLLSPPTWQIHALSRNLSWNYRHGLKGIRMFSLLVTHPARNDFDFVPSWVHLPSAMMRAQRMRMFCILFIHPDCLYVHLDLGIRMCALGRCRFGLSLVGAAEDVAVERFAVPAKGPMRMALLTAADSLRHPHWTSRAPKTRRKLHCKLAQVMEEKGSCEELAILMK